MRWIGSCAKATEWKRRTGIDGCKEGPQEAGSFFFLLLALQTPLFVSSCCYAIGVACFQGRRGTTSKNGASPNFIVESRREEIIEETQRVTNFTGLIYLSHSDCECIHGQAGARLYLRSIDRR